METPIQKLKMNLLIQLLGKAQLEAVGKSPWCPSGCWPGLGAASSPGQRFAKEVACLCSLEKVCQDLALPRCSLSLPRTCFIYLSRSIVFQRRSEALALVRSCGRLGTARWLVSRWTLWIGVWDFSLSGSTLRFLVMPRC